MIEIDRFKIEKRLHQAEMMYNDAVEYFNTVSTDESIERLAIVTKILNRNMMLLKRSYKRLNNLMIIY
jgi:hypothetical protein